MPTAWRSRRPALATSSPSPCLGGLRGWAPRRAPLVPGTKTAGIVTGRTKPPAAAPAPRRGVRDAGGQSGHSRGGAAGRQAARYIRPAPREETCPRAEPGEAAGYAHKRGIGDARAAAGPCQCRCLASAAAHRPSLFSARSPAWSARVRFRRCHRYAGGLCPHPPGGQRTRWPCWQTAAARCRRSGGGVSVGQRLRRGAGWPDWRSRCLTRSGVISCER